jgi:hypothetical protein
VEIADGYVRIHLDGLPKAADLWMAWSSPTLFIDGGLWSEENEANEMPEKHYWAEMDTMCRR